MEEAIQADKVADPWSITGTITRCFGVTESISRRVEEITKQVDIYSISRPEAPLQSVPTEMPEVRSALARRLEDLYRDLTRIENSLDRISIELSD